MKELLRTNDPVLLSFLEFRLKEAGITPILMDTHMSVVEGSLGILPRRLMVADEDFAQADRLVAEVRAEAGTEES